MVTWKSDPAVAVEAVPMLLKACTNVVPNVRSSVVDNMADYRGESMCIKMS